MDHLESNLEVSSNRHMLPKQEPKGKKRKTKKEDAGIKTKNKKIKKEPLEGKRQMSMNEWLSQGRRDKERKRHVQFSRFVAVKRITCKGTLSLKSHTIQLQDDIDCANRWSSFKLKRLRDRKNLKRLHEKRKQEATPRRQRIRNHILDTIRQLTVLNLF